MAWHRAAHTSLCPHTVDIPQGRMNPGANEKDSGPMPPK